MGMEGIDDGREGKITFEKDWVLGFRGREEEQAEWGRDCWGHDGGIMMPLLLSSNDADNGE